MAAKHTSKSFINLAIITCSSNMEDSLNHTKNESINPESTDLSQQPIEDSVISMSNPPVGISLSSQGTERFSSTSRLADTKLDSRAKIAIPRLQYRTPPRAIRRVPRACHSCRQRKTKCSGDTPACRQCLELRVICGYPLGKTDKMKEQLGKTTEKSQEYEDMLKHTVKLVGARAAEQIKNLLNKHNSGLKPPADTEEQEDGLEIDGTSSPSSIGSLEAIDRVEEDFNQTNQGRSTGFMGKNSEITWMRQLQKEAKQRSHGLEGEIQSISAQSPENEFKLPAFNYHLDDLRLDITDDSVNPFEIPPRQQVDQLFEDYMRTVHPFFPILNKPLFSKQCYKFLDHGASPSNKWLAIFNMVLAIAAKHTQILNSPKCGNDQDHALYIKRACTLSMNQKALFDHPDLQQVQVEGLIAFYLLSAGHINRAWRFSALAVRSAIGLGVNMKIRSDSIPNIQKESRYRVWWSLYTLEHMLGIITGRTTCIRDGVCTTPLPVPFEEECLHEQAASELLNDAQLRDERINRAMPSWLVRQMPLNPQGGKEASYAYRHKDSSWIRSVPVNWGLYYLFYCDLAIIVQEIVNKVYSVDCVVIPWAHIENRIGELRARVDLWLSNLPPSLDFTSKVENDSEWIQGKLNLAFHFYSARITLGRPCLCRRDARPINPEQKETFSHSIAVVTLESAAHMLDLLPETPDGVLLFQISPWFVVTHYIMQAATVLLLELAFGCVHMPEQEFSFLSLSKKSIRWLHAMAKHSMASLRAWQLCDLAFRRLAMGMAYSTDNLPTCMDNVLDGSSIKRSTETQQNALFEGHSVEGMPSGSLHQTPYENQFSFYLDHGNFPTEEMNSWTFNTAEPDFPYDPVSSGFIQSIFPEEIEQENFDHF